MEIVRLVLEGVTVEAEKQTPTGGLGTQNLGLVQVTLVLAEGVAVREKEKKNQTAGLVSLYLGMALYWELCWRQAMMVCCCMAVCRAVHFLLGLLVVDKPGNYHKENSYVYQGTFPDS